ncbi:acetolactate synthase large subunit [Parahaliea sp. F7430]|uniref:Acetolactate synthase large subunit n=1 Tax=Sediminihaliea albiluteola TaxID=2758564 RepID=A0A7W2YK83_9GAMM|nr:acetolactate synthase large subunit [Sediminihaliea albiluteola]MBA6413419.1 acetolactate synthase large subunit [Sediminihaliea albiluteola]
MTKASDLLVRALEQEGVNYVFGIPGEENLDFLDSLSRSQKIQLILTRHEQAAGFMAATYGRLTGKAGVCMATLGPGATNLTTAAAYAQLGGMPMLMITGQKPIKSSKQGRFQILDVVEMMRPITKYAQQIVSGDNIPSRVREALRLAEEEKPGAVHLELPEDIAAEETQQYPVQPSMVRRAVAEEKAVRIAVERIATARSPILVIGAGANRKLTSKVLTQLVDDFAIPFATTQLGKGVIDERHPLFMGCTALSAGDFVHRAIEAADLIINVGHDVIEKPPFFMRHGQREDASEDDPNNPVEVPEGTQVIHISFRSAEVDPVYFPQLEVIGDIANAIWQIKSGLAEGPRPNWDFARMKAVKKHHDANIAKGEDDQRFPIYPQYLVAQVRRVMPDDGIICLDNGIYKIWFARNYSAHSSNTVLLDNALASMGAGLPSAMAAHLVYPERKVMAICGDGGFMMNSQELETAVRLKMNLSCLILNDSSYGMIRWKQANMGFADWGLQYGNPDFVKYAESYGAQGHRITSSAQLGPLLEQCLNSEGVHLIDCPVDYSENDQILNYSIKQLSAAI